MWPKVSGILVQRHSYQQDLFFRGFRANLIRVDQKLVISLKYAGFEHPETDELHF